MTTISNSDSWAALQGSTNNGQLTVNSTSYYGVTPPVNEISKRLTLIPARNDNFVGRLDELKQLKDDLVASGVVFIVNGIGGIGKSELAYKYLLDHEINYKHVALFKFSGKTEGLRDKLYESLKQTLFLLDNATIDDIFRRLQSLPAKCLLVFDGLSNEDDINSLKLLNNNCDVLISTRIKVSGFKFLDLGILSNSDARQLFKKHFHTEDNIDDILEYIDGHSLFIELVAKTLHEGYFSLDELREKFKNNEFVKIDRNFEKTFNDFLIKIFQIEENSKLKKLLQLLSIFPSIEIDYETLHEIFNQNGRLKIELNELVKRGWLINNGESYKLHQVIKEFVLENHAISFDVATSHVIEVIAKLLDPNNSYLNPFDKKHYIDIIKSILSRHYSKISHLSLVNKSYEKSMEMRYNL